MSDIATRAKLRADSEQKLRDAAFGALSEQETKEVTVQENPTDGASSADASELTPEQVAVLKRQLGLDQPTEYPREIQEAIELREQYLRNPDDLVWRMLEHNEGMSERLASRSEPDPWDGVDQSEIEANPMLRALKAENDRNRAELSQMKQSLAAERQQQEQAQLAARNRSEVMARVKQELPDVTSQELTDLSMRYKTQDGDTLLALAKLNRLENSAAQEEIAEAERASALPHTSSSNPAPPGQPRLEDMSTSEMANIAAQGLMAQLGYAESSS